MTLLEDHRPATIPSRVGEDMTVTSINIADLQKLIAGGAQVVEVLPGATTRSSISRARSVFRCRS